MMHDHGNCARCDAQDAALAEAELERDALKATIDEIHAIIPATFYAGLGVPTFRVEELVRVWRNAVEANKCLEADLAAMRARAEFAQHRFSCDTLRSDRPPGPCDCGFADLAAMKAERDTAVSEMFVQSDGATESRAIDAALASSPGAAWTPTPENVNALPDAIRRFIHDLETRCDPAGDVQRIAALEGSARGLEAERATRLATAREVVEHMRKFLVAPSGSVLCACRNREAAKAGTETPCWYCKARALLARPEVQEMRR